MTVRRLPIYLLLDCSESMAGPAIEAVAQGMHSLVAELKTSPHALETAYLSVITFAREAKQIIPLTELITFQPPKLSVRPGTSLGAALRLLLQSLKNEVMRPNENYKGDYKPLVFILTDGEPTDDWETAAKELKAASDPKIANIISIGCGPDVDYAVLHYISDAALLMPDLSGDAFRKLFVWLTASVKTASMSMGTGQAEGPFSLPAIPENVLEFAPRSRQIKEKMPRQVFLQATCTKTKKHYLMRYKLNSEAGFYDAVAAHPLDSFTKDDEDLLPPINSSLLNGVPPCPYCGNPKGVLCPCGALFCDPQERQPVAECPRCESQLRYGGEGSFDIQRTQG